MRKKKNARANKVRYGRQESMKRKRDIKKEKIGTTPINDFFLFIYLFLFIFLSTQSTRFEISKFVSRGITRFSTQFPPNYWRDHHILCKSFRKVDAFIKYIQYERHSSCKKNLGISLIIEEETRGTIVIKFD